MTQRRDWPIVVGGCHRSGTSLVRRILDAHPGIHCGPEVSFFRDFYGDFSDDPFARLRFSRTARDLVAEEEALAVLGRAFVELHERAARRVGKPRWADKAPENVLHAEAWWRLLEGRLFFVHVVRNPLDTIASMEGRFPLTLPADLEGRIDHWIRYTEAGLAMTSALSDRSLRVVYEDLCTSPGAEVARLMRGLGEEPDERQLSLDGARHDEGLEDPAIALTTEIHGRSVGRWRSVLHDDDAGLVWRRTEDLWRQIDPLHHQTLVRGFAAPTDPG